jgi:CubicO group peptidase (beta-lactamase class C family)
MLNPEGLVMLRRLFRLGLWGVCVLLAVAAIALWWNWSMVMAMSTAKSRGVDILDGYKPLTAIAGAPMPSAPGPDDPPTPVPERLKEAFDYSDQHDGLAMIVSVRDQVIAETYGANVGPANLFETFSMHKSVMGLLYGAAIRDGVIGSIDDPIGKYVDELAKDPRGAIRLIDFLSMSSGLKFYSLNKGEWPALQLVMSDRVSATALSIPADKPPGTQFEYYNVNSQLAGIALDRALRKAGKGGYAAYLESALWQKIGAQDARLWIEHEGGDPRFFSGLQAHARDWLKIGRLIANGGKVGDAQVIPADWIARMTAPSPHNPNYGIQIWRGSPWSDKRAYGPNTPFKVPHAQPYAVDDIVFFDGFGGERVYVSPNLALVIVRIGRPKFDFDDSVIPNAVIKGLELKP